MLIPYLVIILILICPFWHLRLTRWYDQELNYWTWPHAWETIALTTELHVIIAIGFCSFVLNSVPDFTLVLSSHRSANVDRNLAFRVVSPRAIYHANHVTTQDLDLKWSTNLFDKSVILCTFNSVDYEFLLFIKRKKEEE